MPASPISEELLAETAALYREHGSIMAAARAAGVPRQTMQHRVHKAVAAGLLGFKPVPPGFEISQIATRAEDGSHVKMRPERGPEFQVPEGMTVKGVSALVDGQGRVIQQWIKPTLDQVHNAIAEALEKRFAGGPLSTQLPAPAVSEAGLLSIYPIADQHLGLLAWGRETGDAYDLKIGCARLRDCTQRLVAQSPPSETAIILNLGDWQHTDDEKNVTPGHGFTLDVDSRYFKLVQAGVDLMVDVVELALQKHQRVVVRNLPGNHDPHAHVALTMGLRGHYREHPRVTVLAEPSEFFYYRWHNNFIGATHGHKIKPAKMVMDMAVSHRDDWAKADFRYFLFGHIHHETALEVGDVRCESFQTIASKDAYSHSHGLGAGRSLTSITLHAQDGEIGRHRVNIPPTEKSQAMSREQAIPVIQGYWYLATPYSKWPYGLRDANVVAQMLAADLLSFGVKVYSPIAHTHGIAAYTGVDKRDHNFWLAADKPLLDAAGGLLVADLPGWQDSKGVTLEIQWAKEQKKPYWLLNPVTLAVQSLPV